MSDLFVGIENENEFFTQHYLAAILAGDLKPVLGAWRDAAAQRREATDGPARTPPTALGLQHTELFRHLDRRERLRSPALRVEAHREVLVGLLEALGYTPQRSLVPLADGHLPLLAAVPRADGSPLLWVVPVAAAPDDDRPALSRPILQAQIDDAQRDPAAEPARAATGPVEELVSAAFDRDEPPRFVLVCGESDIWLLERAKWAEQRLLRFDLAEILGRRDPDTLDITAALLHRDSLTPHAGAALLDTLDDSSHKHAFEVSEDLKYALQACIERLGNAAIAYRRDTSRQKVFGTDIADQLSRECLRYMYRLLFLFYIEARPELGYAPMGSDAYRLGYSLERLRDLEQADLLDDESRLGTTIHDSLRLLFTLVHDGADPYTEARPLFRDADRASLDGAFRMEPLRSHLFDPSRTPILNAVRFPNEVLRDVIEWMSLSRAKGGARRGRISYATLGINQLGAVYEALLSYRGFFAETDLFEVKPAKQSGRDVLQTAYFVPEDELSRYSPDERVYEDDGVTLRRYPRGTFIYRLAGRDRQTSASYYTPEVLTRALVRYTLAERLYDERGAPRLTADQILDLTVCEPAMGSAAFLNEAVSQLAEAYLQAKQCERGERIPHDRYAHEKQRVKMYLADNNVYGVDLNPVAVELAEVSLWLNTIHAGGFVPYFGGQLRCGNSLIGARRQVYTRAQVRAGREGKRADWLDATPARVPLGAPRPAGSVYHFLLGDRAMSVYGQGNEGKPIKELAGDALDAIEAWRADFCRPVSDDDHAALVALSDAADRLWDAHVGLLRRVRARTTDPLPVYGRPLPHGAPGPTTTAEKDAIWAAELESERVRAASPYRRLKLVMDYWCALWFWPIEHADLLPDRDEHLADLALLLDTDVLSAMVAEQTDLFAPTMPADEAKALAKELGVVDVDRVVARSERLRLVVELAERYRFLHWELAFADVFADRGGFDVMLGNPPWVRPVWEEKDVLGDMDPVFAVKSISLLEAAERRPQVLADPTRRAAYLAEHEKTVGTKWFLMARQNYPDLSGPPNLYKCFLPLAWAWTSEGGVAGLVHPEGVYDDPKGGALREALYPRLRRHYQFINEQNLFVDVDHHQKFSLNVYGPRRARPRFVHLANLFTPSTIDACHEHVGRGPVPGLKEGGAWATDGHRARLIEVGPTALALFAAVYDDEGTPPNQARLPALHSRQMVPVLDAFRDAPLHLTNLTGWFQSRMWHESGDKRNGTIARAEPAAFPPSPAHLILSGPHFFVGNPHYKTPRAPCTNNSHYDVLDLTALPADYLPRTNYLPACAPSAYAARVPKVPWGTKPPVTAFYRVVVARMIGPAGERTLQPAICVAPAGHVHTVNSYAFARTADLLAVAAGWSALPVDFFVKSTGSGELSPYLARQLPVPTRHLPQLFARVLLLNGLTTHYAALWADAFDPAFRADRWAKSDPRLPDAHFASLGPAWTWETPLRTDYARRQALVELDVLVAMGLGLTLDQLQTLYRAQFYVLRGYEDDTWYDRNGRIVFTNSKGLVGVGLPRTTAKSNPTPAWSDVQHMTSGQVEHEVLDDTLPGGPRQRTIVYEAPFDRCDREADYATAWRHFEARLGREDG